jgi:hypothetical protein
MALRWTSAAMLEAVKGFRRLKAHKQLSALRAALAAHQAKHAANSAIEPEAASAAHNRGRVRPVLGSIIWTQPGLGST